jgi:hypothetical protein
MDLRTFHQTMQITQALPGIAGVTTRLRTHSPLPTGLARR